MSETPLAIRLHGVSKNYVVHTKPRYWLADFLGLSRLLREGRHYRSFWALRDIDLEIPRGAKIALIGRNGAGKSTLLRIISENIVPTTGEVEVNGRCEALMQLGAGFNPEFTGRECVMSALAYMGLNKKRADEKLWDILDFSELEEFIDQPVRTYSSGMYLRLAFSVATVIAPEILIIDEILAAGDMYFQSKCLARIQELTSGPGTTVLFVSHDMESAQRICDTFVWLERGRIVARGKSADIRAIYEDSVRKQQELRLRARNLRLSRRILADLESHGEEGFHLLGRLVVEGSTPGPHIDAIRTYVRGQAGEAIAVGDAMDDNSAHYTSFVMSEGGGSSWGPSEKSGTRWTRRVSPPVGALEGARFALFIHHDLVTDPDYHIEIAVDYQDSTRSPTHLELNAAAAGMKRILTLEHAGDGQWKTLRAAVPRWLYAPPGSTVPAPADGAGGQTTTGSVPSEKRFGTGQVTIGQVHFLRRDGTESFVFQTGEPLTLTVAYATHDSALVGTPLVCAVGFERIDGVMAATLISTLQEQPFALEDSGTVRLTLDPLLLTRGTYRVSVVLFSELDLHGFSPHFTRSPSLFDMHRLAYEIAVEGTYAMEIGLLRHPVRWESVAGGPGS
jgi:lipopolysaccharide transport system ATP-binding protein